MSGATRTGLPRIGLLGGTFDPPHLAHLVLAAAARRALHLDRVVFVPAGDPWRKTDRGVTPAESRLRIVRAAVESALPWAEVSAVEVQRSRPTYTVDTLEELRTDAPDAHWWSILGWDALADLPNWHQPERIIALARIAVAQRGDPPETVPAAPTEALPALGARVDPVPMPRLDISASDLRRRVREGLPTAPLLPTAVRRAIEELGLYRD